MWVIWLTMEVEMEGSMMLSLYRGSCPAFQPGTDDESGSSTTSAKTTRILSIPLGETSYPLRAFCGWAANSDAHKHIIVNRCFFIT